MIERPHTQDGGMKPNGVLITTEAPITVSTPDGAVGCPTGTTFHVSLVTKKLPAGARLDGYTSTKEKPLYGNVGIHWTLKKYRDTWENGGSLRRKIIQAENRQTWWRSLVIGATAGTMIEVASRIFDAIPG